jgi:hypothetical protein
MAYLAAPGRDGTSKIFRLSTLLLLLFYSRAGLHQKWLWEFDFAGVLILSPD